MVAKINIAAAVTEGDYTDALRKTAVKIATDIDNCDDAAQRSTLARTLSTVLTALRLAETGKAKPASSGGGNGILAALQAEADEQSRGAG